MLEFLPLCVGDVSVSLLYFVCYSRLRTCFTLDLSLRTAGGFRRSRRSNLVVACVLPLLFQHFIS